MKLNTLLGNQILRMHCAVQQLDCAVCISKVMGRMEDSILSSGTADLYKFHKMLFSWKPLIEYLISSPLHITSCAFQKINSTHHCSEANSVKLRTAQWAEQAPQAPTNLFTS